MNLSIKGSTPIIVTINQSHLLSPGQMITTFQHNMVQHCWAQLVPRIWPPCYNMLVVTGSSLSQKHPICHNTLLTKDVTKTHDIFLNP